MSFDDLSDEQKAAFAARLAAVGINPDDVVREIGPHTHQGPVILSLNPDESAIPPHIFTVERVEDLKQMHGIPDEHYAQGIIEEHHPVPKPWPADRVVADRSDLSITDYHDVHQAHLAYLYGNSANVASYTGVINAIEYPRDVAVYAAEVLNITAANSPFVVKPSDAGHIYGVVTIYEGGSMQFQGNTDFNAQKMVKSTATGPA